MKENLEIGNIVECSTSKGKIIGKLIKKNPKYAIIDVGEKQFYKVPYYPLKISENTSFNIERNITIEKSDIETNEDLKGLLNSVKLEYIKMFNDLFSIDELEKFNYVKIRFGKIQTYRNCGTFYHAKNEIKITSSFKNVPEYVIKQTIFHELLHIHFKTTHGSIFRMYERKYKDHEKAKKFVHELFKVIRSNGKIEFKDSKTEIKKPEKKPVIKSNIPISNIDKRWKEIQEKRKKQLALIQQKNN